MAGGAGYVGSVLVEKLISYNYNVEVVEKIHELSESNSNIKFDLSLDRRGCTSYVCGNRTKITYFTGWEPKVNLIEGIKKTIKYYRNKI